MPWPNCGLLLRLDVKTGEKKMATVLTGWPQAKTSADSQVLVSGKTVPVAAISRCIIRGSLQAAVFPCIDDEKGNKKDR